MKKLAILLLLASPLWAQTHTFPALDTDNHFTGQQTVTNLNSTIVFDGVKYATIQAAINVAVSGNATIVVPINSAITTGLTISQPNVTLRCDNGAVITKGANIDMLTISAANVTVRDCTFDGVQTSWTGGAIDLIGGSGNALIENNNFKNMKDSSLAVGAIYITGSSNNTIRNNRFTNIDAFGIHGRNNSNSEIIDGNYIDTTLSNGLAAASDISAHAVTAGQTVNDWIISNNVILHGGNSFCIEVGDFGGATALRPIIQGNSCKITTSTVSFGGISLGSTNYPGTDGAIVSGNTVDANGFPISIGIEESQATRATVIGNTVKMGAQSGTGTGAFMCDPCGNSAFVGNIASAAFSGTNEGLFNYINSLAVAANNTTFVGNVADLTGSSVAAYAFRSQCNNAGATCNGIAFGNNTGIGVNIANDAGLRFQHSSGTQTGNIPGTNNFTNFNARYTLDIGTFSPPIFPSGGIFTEGAPTGAASGVDACGGDSTAHALKCSYNNGSFLQIPQIVSAGLSPSLPVCTDGSNNLTTSSCGPAIQVYGYKYVTANQGVTVGSALITDLQFTPTLPAGTYRAIVNWAVYVDSSSPSVVYVTDGTHNLGFCLSAPGSGNQTGCTGSVTTNYTYTSASPPTFKAYADTYPATSTVCSVTGTGGGTCGNFPTGTPSMNSYMTVSMMPSN